MTVKKASLHIMGAATILALFARSAGGCVEPSGVAEAAGAGGAPAPLATGGGSEPGSGSSSGGSSSGGSSSDGSSTGSPADGGVDVVVPIACASDGVGRPLATHAGGEGYHLATGERIAVGNAMFARVVIGDVTGDGRADVVGAELDAAWIFPQQGDGSFGAPIVVAHSFGNPPSVALLQATADTTLDLVVTGWMGLDVIPSLGAGSFGPATHVSTVFGFDLEVADINRDGHDDIIVPSPDGLILAYGDGAGSLGNAELLTGSYGQIGYQIAMGDVTGDQIPDLVSVTPTSAPGLIMVPHNGVDALSTSGWSKLSFPGEAVAGFALGDVNADGLLDVVVQQDDNTDYDVRTRLIPGAVGGFGPPIEIAKSSYGGAVVIADVNADGRGDVVLVHSGGFEVGVVLSTPAGMGPHQSTMVPTAASVASYALAVGDVDCDGCPDVVTSDVGGLVVFRGQGCGASPGP